MKNITFLKKHFFTTFIFTGTFLFCYLLLSIFTTSAFPIWTYSPGFTYQGPFLAKMYPFSLYSPMINPFLSFPNSYFQPLPYGESSSVFNWQNPILSWSQPVNRQFFLGGLSNNLKDIQWGSHNFAPGYLPERNPAFSRPNSFLNDGSIFPALNPLWPITPVPLARSAALTSPPPSLPSTPVVGIESHEFKYKPSALESLGVTYVPGQPAYVTGQVLVTFRPGTPPMEMNRVYASHQCRELYHSLYAGFKTLSIPSFVTVKEMCRRLSLEPSVLYTSPNYYRHAHQVTPDDPYYSYQWHLPKLDCQWAWLNSTGTGAVVAVLDSGVAYQTAGIYAQAPDLGGTIFVPGYDFINLDASPDDDYGHGTHIAGCIAQTTNNLLGVAGVAFNAVIMPVKILDNVGSGTVANEIDGIYFATNSGAKIINISFGGAGYTASEQTAVTDAYNSGVTIISSAGNAGSNIPEYPASFLESISVSAIRYDYTIPAYSNYGQYITVCAPGGDLTVDQNWDGFGDGILQQTHNGNDFSFFYYFFAEGTSQACALVSGVAALIVSKSTIPLTPLQVTDILIGSAADLGTTGWDEYYGHGLVNAYQALL